MSNRQLIDISTSTILRFILIISGLVFIYLIRNILVMVFIAVIIAAAVDTPIDWLARRKIRRGLAVAMVYVSVLAIFALVVYLIVPLLASQIKSLALSLPDYLLQLEGKLQGMGGKIGTQALQDLLVRIGDKLSSAAGDVFAATINIFGGVISGILVLVVSIYLAAEEKGIKNFTLSLISPTHHSYVATLVDRILFKLGAWLRGQLIIMAVLGVLTYIGLTLLKIKFALTLALVAGLLEIVPIIGPILSAVPAIIFAFIQSPILALVVAALYYVIHELENYLIVPQVMKRTVGLNPISILIAVMIGGELYGIIGVVVAIPLAAIISVIFQDLLASKRLQV